MDNRKIEIPYPLIGKNFIVTLKQPVMLGNGLTTNVIECESYYHGNMDNYILLQDKDGVIATMPLSNILGIIASKAEAYGTTITI